MNQIIKQSENQYYCYILFNEILFKNHDAFKRLLLQFTNGKRAVTFVYF